MDPAKKRAARQTMGETVEERDIDRLLNAARSPGGGSAGTAAVSRNEFASRLDLHRTGTPGVLSDVLEPRAVSVFDIPVFILYACLGVFTRIWTDVTLYFDFGEDNGFKVFAIAVSIALHLFIFAIIGNAWRAKWEIKTRNLLALAVLAGYLGFRTLTQI